MVPAWERRVGDLCFTVDPYHIAQARHTVPGNVVVAFTLPTGFSDLVGKMLNGLGGHKSPDQKRLPDPAAEEFRCRTCPLADEN